LGMFAPMDFLCHLIVRIANRLLRPPGLLTGTTFAGSG
jgi:hypothetical protein